MWRSGMLFRQSEMLSVRRQWEVEDE